MKKIFPLVLNEDKTPAVNWLNNSYIVAATSSNTRKAYRSDIRHFEAWGGKLPATPDVIAKYLHFYANQLNPRTLARRLIAIQHWHTYQGFSDPTSHIAIKKTMTGILRTFGKPKDKARALQPEELQLIHNYLLSQSSLNNLRDDALLQVGFFGALRRNELVAIQYEHIQWEKDGITILLPSSKTDQQHEGQFSSIPYGTEDLCAINALKKWLSAAKITTGPIFRRIISDNQIGSHALTPLSVNHILKKCAALAGINEVDQLSSHSLRRGLATSAAKTGARLETIMRAGRWKQTNTVMEYIESSNKFSDNAAKNILDSFGKK